MSLLADPPAIEPVSAPDVPTAWAFPWPALWLILLSLSAVASSLLVVLAHGQRGFFLPILALCVCLAAAYTDALTGRIPNYLTYGAILAGLAINSLAPVLHHLGLTTAATWLAAVGPGASWLGFAVCLGLAILCGIFSLLAPSLGGINGGDLKLLAGLGALLGLLEIGNVLIVALTLAVAYSIINLLCLGRLTMALQMAAIYLMELIYTRRIQAPAPDDPAPSSPLHFPMAVPIAIGLLLVQYWHWRTGEGGLP